MLNEFYGDYYLMTEIDVLELKKMKDNSEDFILLDVREKNEIDFASVNPHINISIGEIAERHQELEKNKKIIVMCHSGVRSANVCEYLKPLGYNVYNLNGGINSWSELIDSSVPIY